MPQLAVLSETDEWIDVMPRRKPRGGLEADVVVMMSINKRTPKKANVFLKFRGEAAEWIRAQDGRFSVQSMKSDPDVFRILPNPAGDLKVSRTGGLTRLFVGEFKDAKERPIWPVEKRDSTAALDYDGASDFLLVRMPKGFSKPRGK